MTDVFRSSSFFTAMDDVSTRPGLVSEAGEDGAHRGPTGKGKGKEKMAIAEHPQAEVEPMTPDEVLVAGLTPEELELNMSFNWSSSSSSSENSKYVFSQALNSVVRVLISVVTCHPRLALLARRIHRALPRGLRTDNVRDLQAS